MAEPRDAGTSGSGDLALELSGITVRFGDTLANEDVSLALRRGETLALLGENGAGKTTLVNVLFGHYVPDAGTVRVDGRLLPPGRPRAAIAAGIGMVHQHFSLADNLTVLENVMTGTRPLWSVRSGTGEARAKLDRIAERFGLEVRADARVGALSVGERQRVEIVKALYNEARILVLDEPTAVLTDAEAERLFATLATMTARGLSIVLISHKLDQVLAAADRVIVIRAGRTVAERVSGETDRTELAALMVGRTIERPVRAAARPGEPVLRAAGVDVAGALHGIGLELRAGETLGIVGVSGNGQSALGELLCGVRRADAGTLELFGEPFPQGDVPALVAAGVGRVPEDRGRDGAIAEMSVWENAILERSASPPFSRAGLVSAGPARAFAARLIERHDVRGGGPDHRIGLLSGGNVQKLVLGRALDPGPRLVIAAQPTRGLDEGAIAAVHENLLAARDAGAAVLLISEDLDEVMRLADRIQAICRGRLSAPVRTEDADARTLGLMMAGVTADVTAVEGRAG